MLLKIRNLDKSYTEGSCKRRILSGISLDLSESELLVLTGKSGSGKSTLLNLIAGLDSIDSGEIFLEKCAIHHLSPSGLAALRLRKIGIVFQFFNLLPDLTVYQNVCLPLHLDKNLKYDKRERVVESLTRVNALELSSKFPHQLSGGEMQRAAIARAIVQKPRLIIADEPTGNLDEANGRLIVDLFQSLISEDGISVLAVTHNPDLFGGFGRRVKLVDGHIS